MKGLEQTLGCIPVCRVAEFRLLPVFQFYEPFYGCFRGVVGLVVRIGIIVLVILREGVAHAEIKDLQGNDPEEELTAGM